MDTTDRGLRFGPLGAGALHLCVDMRAMFAERTAWHTPGVMRVLPNVLRVVERDPARTIFTRFVPARSAEAARGAWRRYYRRWRAMTLDALDPALVELVAPLAAHVPPAEVLDKDTYSPWHGGDLAARLDRRGADALVVTGCETDVCVLGAVMGAVDRGCRVVLAADALCSASDAAHDAAMLLYRTRYRCQIEVVSTGQLLEAWA